MTTELSGVMVGAGYFAGIQAEAWRRIPGARIKAVADLDGGRAARFGAQWGIERSYADVARMLDEERPDFVDIVTRPESHLALTALAAERGVHVICQKPLAPSWEDSVAIVQSCGRRNVRCLVNENWRFQPWFRQCRRLIEAGAVGKLFYLGFQTRSGDGRGPLPYSVQPYFREMPRLLVYETGIHFLDTFRYLAGEIARVTCHVKRVNPAIRGEDLALVHVAFQSGVDGLIDANRIAGPSPPPPAFGTLRIEGEDAVLRVTPEGALMLAHHGESERRHPYEIPAEGYRGDSARAAQEHLVACLRDGTRAESEGEDYLKTTAAMFACYQSAETGTAVAPASLLGG